MILDTNAISAWAENDPALNRVLRPDRPWYLPSIVIGEFRFGILGSTKRAGLESWLERVESFCGVLPVDADTAACYAQLRHAVGQIGRQIPYHDIWIGALAIQHEYPVVARDAHFDVMPGVRRVGW